VGEKCKINSELKVAEACFRRVGLRWRDDLRLCLGEWAVIFAIYADETVVLRFEDGKQLRFPVDCIHKEDGVSNLIRVDEDTRSWPREMIISHEEEMKTELTRLRANSESSIRRNKNTVAPHQSPTASSCKNEIWGKETRKEPWPRRSDSMPPKLDLHYNPNVDPGSWEESRAALNRMKEFLASLNLKNHQRGLVREGFETMEDLANAKMEDLLACGLKRGHARRMMRALEELWTYPDLEYEQINRRLQRRPSFGEHRGSLLMALHQAKISKAYNHPLRSKQHLDVSQAQVASLTSSPLSQGQEYSFSSGKHNNDGLQEYGVTIPQLLVNHNHSMSNSLSGSNSSSQRTSFTSSMYADEAQQGYMIVHFDRRPLGFGIMAPLVAGTMVSSITDESLKKKGLNLGVPILRINNVDVTWLDLDKVANILSHVEVPFTVTVGLEPYFKPGQKIMVCASNNQWQSATVVKMSKNSRKVSVRCDSQALNSRLKIVDYSRIKSHPTKPTTQKLENANADTQRTHVMDRSPASNPATAKSLGPNFRELDIRQHKEEELDQEVATLRLIEDAVAAALV